MYNSEHNIQSLVNKCTAVQERSDDWDIINAYLAVCSGTSKAVVSNIYRFNTSLNSFGFQNLKKNKLTLPCWIPINFSDPVNSPENISMRGYYIGKKGFIVSFCNIDINKEEQKNLYESEDLLNLSFLNDSNAETNMPFRSKQYFLLCDVCVGYSMAIDSLSETKFVTAQSLPLGYDSLIIIDKSEMENANRKTLTGAKNNTINKIDIMPPKARPIYFKIFDSRQILPRFLVCVDVYSHIPELFGAEICKNCNNQIATIYCLSDKVRFCTDCDEFIHSKNNILKKHHRVALANAPPSTLGNCEFHCNEEYTAYCLVCERAICNICSELHQHDIRSNDHFIPLLNAFLVLSREGKPATGIKEQNESSELETYRSNHTIGELLAERKKKIKDKISEIDCIINQLDTKGLNAKKTCNEIIQRTVNKLNYWCEISISQALGPKLFYMRRFKDIEAASKFIKYLATILPAADYLRAWLSYCKFVK